jgi:D-tyrosyl-tRNA(Tyr) deacylase
MRGLVQRVKSANVTVAGEQVGAIGQGLCVLVGVTHDDTADHARKMAEKIWHLRVMDDEAGVMNKSVADTTREVLVVSQFTLYGDTNGGRRPSWIAAARPELLRSAWPSLEMPRPHRLVGLAPRRTSSLRREHPPAVPRRCARSASPAPPRHQLGASPLPERRRALPRWHPPRRP